MHYSNNSLHLKFFFILHNFVLLNSVFLYNFKEMVTVQNPVLKLKKKIPRNFKQGSSSLTSAHKFQKQILESTRRVST
jgi:hypothetical protein